LATPERLTAPANFGRKGGERIVALVACHFNSTSIANPHCDILLVGGSLGNDVYGFDTTLPATLDMMILHGKVVVDGSRS
jgi:3-methyl-2-oxobutanoate hydroxymethyltransferase